MMMDLPSLIEKYKMNITGVLHCGANEGQERDLYESIGAKEVIWIEAIPSVCDTLVANLIGYSKHSVICACLGDKEMEDVVFNISNNQSQSSSYMQLGHHSVIHPEVSYVSNFKTTTRRLDSLIPAWEMARINFVNLDLQGAEMKAIKGMGYLIQMVNYLWVEVNKQETYQGCSLVDELDAYLYEFKRVETGEWVADCWTDALYIRKTML